MTFVIDRTYLLAILSDVKENSVSVCYFFLYISLPQIYIPIFLDNKRFFFQIHNCSQALQSKQQFERMTDAISPTVWPKNPRLLIHHLNDPSTLGPIIGYAQEPLLPLADACESLTTIVYNIMTYVSIALASTPAKSVDGLTHDEAASVHLYTMECSGGTRSLYSILNHTLKTADREDLRPWFKYLKLFLTAVAKIPCEPPQTVWRGVRRNISSEYPRGAQVTWWAFSSCTTTLTVLKSNLYLGNTGERTLFSIEVINGRNIRSHSHFANEDEILLLPGTYMEVQSQLNPAPDLYIVHLKQKIPEEILLEPPFEGIFELL